jgi:Domain of unknown function (DUF5615)
VRFLIDANLPPALARWLVGEGHEAHHVRDFGLEDKLDREIWQRARDINACIVTKDEDFVFSMRSTVPALPSFGFGLAIRSAARCCSGCRRCGRASSQLSSAARKLWR